MSARNATYDILWRVPDGGFASIGVPCNQTDPTQGAFCQNSTFNIRADRSQKWTMFPKMKTAAGLDSPGDADGLLPWSWAERRGA
eukprot:SAG31_NODE_1824_length_7190_cov_43.812015_2_plen_85_part_00